MREEAACTIKEASKILNVPASTLRYWEELGLVHSYRTPESNYRMYSLRALFEASNIAFYRKMGVPIKQLAQVKSSSLENVVSAITATTEHFENELAHMQRRLRRLKYQEALSKHALDLLQHGMREACPTIVRLHKYNPESRWQRQTLVRDMQRYALYIDAANEEMTEAYVDYPEGSEAQVDALHQEQDTSFKLVERRGRKKQQRDEKHTLQNKNKPEQSQLQDAATTANVQGVANDKGTTIDQGAANAQGASLNTAPEHSDVVLWDRASELKHNVVFFEGIATSLQGQPIRIQTQPLFDEVRARGHEPLYALAHFLVSAELNGRQDFYQVWVGCRKGLL